MRRHPDWEFSSANHPFYRIILYYFIYIIKQFPKKETIRVKTGNLKE